MNGNVKKTPDEWRKPMSQNPEAHKTIKIVGICLVLFLFVVFLVVLPDARPGEIASALGAVLGGLVGAGGAVWAVHLAVSQQRDEEISKVSSAVLTEVTAYAKYVIGAVEICNQIKNHGLKIPRHDARYIAKNFWGDPIVYPAVADRVGLLPHPHATTEFYMRLSEVRGILEALRVKTNPEGIMYTAATPEYVTPQFAGTIADSLITALQLASTIIGNVGNASSRETLTHWVNLTVAQQIDECLNSARTSFPDAESFQDAVAVGAAAKSVKTIVSG